MIYRRVKKNFADLVNKDLQPVASVPHPAGGWWRERGAIEA
jgi:hypothetical protein